MPAHDGGAARTAAGVRKPSQKQTSPLLASSSAIAPECKFRFAKIRSRCAQWPTAGDHGHSTTSAFLDWHHWL
jgi:hypothetical protein